MSDDLKLKVLRCRDCGNTFPAEQEHPPCPMCGSESVEVASEPLL